MHFLTKFGKKKTLILKYALFNPIQTTLVRFGQYNNRKL